MNFLGMTGFYMKQKRMGRELNSRETGFQKGVGVGNKLDRPLD